MPLLAPTQTSVPATDRRAARRARPTYNTIFRLGLKKNGRPVDGLVWDLSTCGVGLLLPFAPATGTEFEGELRTEDGRASLPASFAVAHVRRLYTGDYFVGAKFLKPLSEGDVERFALPTPAEQTRPVRPVADTDVQLAGRWRK